MDDLSLEKLAALEQDAKSSLSHKSKTQRYILAKPEDILAMIIEIRELRKMADPQALTAAYMAGAHDKNANPK